MPANFDGVYELRILYSTTPASELLMTHRLTVDVNAVADADPGANFDTVELQPRAGATVMLGTWLTTDFLPLILALYPAESDFYLAELWKIPEGEYNGTFIAAKELAESGVNAVGNQVAQQTTFTFRSQGGGVARIQLMESSFSGQRKQTPPFLSAGANALSTYVTSNDSPIIARDNTPLIARIHQSDGQNEKLWRKRFRSS